MFCTEPYKRVLIPAWPDYSCYTTRKDGVYILKNAAGKVLYQFKDEQEKKEKAQSIIDSFFTLYRIKQVEFECHKIQNPQYYYHSYGEANWAHKALYKGFKCNVEYLPYHNWYGVSTYDPDRVLQRGEKRIIISLQGVYMNMPNGQQRSEGLMEIIKECKAKYLCFMDGQDIVYEEWTGKLPTDEVVEEFIS